MRIVTTALLFAFAIAGNCLAQTTYTYVGPFNGNWNTAANWSPQGIPGALDTVKVETSSVLLNTDVSVANLTLKAVLQGTGNLTIAGTFDLGSSTMTGTGKIILPAGSHLNISGSIPIVLTSGRVIENSGDAFIAQGIRFWYPSGFTNLAGGTVTLSVDSSVAGAAFATASGSSGGSPVITNSGTLIKSGAATSRFDGTVTFNSSGPVDIQQGTLEVASPGTSSGNWTFPSGTTLAMKTGRTVTAGDFSGSGTLLLNAGIVFPVNSFHPSGPVTLLGSVTVNDPWTPIGGSLVVGGSLTMNAPLTVPDLQLQGALAMNAQLTTNSITMLPQGSPSLVLNNDLTLSTLVFRAGNGVTGSGTITVTGETTCYVSFPDFFGSIAHLVQAPGSTLTVPSWNKVSIGTLENHGTINLAGGIYVGASFTNHPDGVVEFTGNAGPTGPLSVEGAGSPNPAQFVNLGIIRKVSAGRGFLGTGNGFVFNNLNVVNVLEGTFQIPATGTDSGSISVSQGAAISFALSRTHDASSTLSGAGSVQFDQNVPNSSHTFPVGTYSMTGGLVVNGEFNNNSAITFNEAITPSSIAINSNAKVVFATDQVLPALTLGGTLDGPATVAIANSLTWEGGTMTGTGKTVMLPGSTTTINWATLNKRRFENHGTVSLLTQLAMYTSSQFENAADGTLNVSSNSTNVGHAFLCKSGADNIVNAGTFNKSGAWSTTIDPTIKFTNTGAINVLAGSLTVNNFAGDTGALSLAPSAKLTLSGTYTVSQPMTIASGSTLSLSGTYTLSGPLTVTSGATLSLSGNYSLTQGLSVNSGAILTLNGSWNNSSTISANGGTLTLLGTWSNTGQFNVTNSTWNIGGTHGSLGGFTTSGSTLTFSGTANAMSIIANASTGNIFLGVATFNNCSFQNAPGFKILTATNASVTLNACTILGDFDVASCGELVITGGLALAPNSLLTLEGGCSRSGMTFNSVAQSITGSGEIYMKNAGTGRAFNINQCPTLTIESGVTIRSGPDAVTDAPIFVNTSRTLINKGTISAREPGRTISITGTGTFSNVGTIEAAPGSISVNPTTLANYTSATSSFNNGSWIADGGSLTIGLRPIAIIASAAKFRFTGPGISTPVFTNLNANAGSLSITALPIAIAPPGGTFTNSGSLELGVGGSLAIAGNCTFQPASTFTTALGGTTPGTFGSIAATGAISLNGALRGAFTSPYTPVEADILSPVLSGASISGAFATTCIDANPFLLGVVPVINAGAPQTLDLQTSASAGTFPVILEQPKSANANPNASFSVVTGPAGVTYFWRRAGKILADGPTASGAVISGSHTATITISSARSTDSGSFDVVVSNACGFTTSQPATLRGCLGDLNIDGLVNDADFVTFINGYDILDCADPIMPSTCPADLNSDGVVDDADFQLFVPAYDALICP